MPRLNCKPGDLAFIVGGSEWAGLIVKVLYKTPLGESFLPDGYPVMNKDRTDCWVLEFPRPVRQPLLFGNSRKGRFGSGRDSCLRPIRGDAEEKAEPRTADLPEPDMAVLRSDVPSRKEVLARMREIIEADS